MAGRKSDWKLEKEKRQADLERLDELFVRLLGFGGAKVQSHDELEHRLSGIAATIKKTFAAGVSVSDMLDLLDTEKEARKLIYQAPELVLRGDADKACHRISETIIKTKDDLFRN